MSFRAQILWLWIVLLFCSANQGIEASSHRQDHIRQARRVAALIRQNKNLSRLLCLRRGDLLSRGGYSCRVTKSFTALFTAYHPRCGKCGTGGLTASGTSAFGAGVAVDPRTIPLGSLVIFEYKGEIRVLVADDTGGKIKGRRIDWRRLALHDTVKRFNPVKIKVTVLVFADR